MADRRDADSALVIGELVDHAIAANVKRAQSAQPSAEGTPGPGLAFEEAEGVLDGVDQRPVEAEQLQPCAARQDDARHCSAGRSALGELPAQILERDRFVP